MRFLRTAGVFLAAGVLAAGVLGAGDDARAQATADTTGEQAGWGPLSFMIGDWVATGTGTGVASAQVSVQPDLDGRILVRRQTAQTESGQVHSDLMIIYRRHDRSFGAMFFDNEGHVIHYSVTPITDPVAGATFLSDEGPNMPRFRLTYTLTDPSTERVVFEIRPPAATEWQIYLSGTARRK